ncbi:MULTISPECIES: DUF2332 domain-containing protein [unclassified Microbacterium]|uniref:DUF2332 domain-containing protein n=1 Tax=unclassified Microbacterium TaxID=2609290 RepID=UPI002274BCB3|nr:DUF2332 domain-containing protein [Microbacterium sp. SL62]MCY1717926.1 DUF2332 domain-containing protein [Microbacterium sp. SL62]
MTQDAVTAVVDRYRRFARDEAPGRSAVYEAWARRVTDDAAVAAALARIPETRRQPPLVFAVMRLLGAPLDDVDAWSSWVLDHADAIVAECGRRSVQTNEPLRCAALLPALSLIEGPIALLEVGASAGLCLFPDRYSYRYRRGGELVTLDPADGPSSVVLDSDLEGHPDLRMPEIVWRAGIDLSPLDARSEQDRSWLTGLVWPGEQGRLERIERALDIAAAAPPVLVAGDGAGALPALAATAPAGATLVVTTPGVLAHVPRVHRAAVIDAARTAGRWITLDAPGLHDGWTRRPEPARGGFALALDGEVLAEVDPLGAWVAWHPESRAAAQ